MMYDEYNSLYLLWLDGISQLDLLSSHTHIPTSGRLISTLFPLHPWMNVTKKWMKKREMERGEGDYSEFNFRHDT